MPHLCRVFCGKGGAFDLQSCLSANQDRFRLGSLRDMISGIVMLVVSIVVGFGVFILLAVTAMLGSTFDWRLWPAIRRAKREMRQIARKRDPDAQVLSRQGATRIDPRHLWFSIRTKTDHQRDQLCEDSTLYPELRDALLRSGYPAASVPLVHFGVQSQETVDRDYGGSWSEADEMPGPDRIR